MKTAALGIGVSGLSLTPLIDDGMYLTYVAGLLISYTAGFLFTYFFGFKEEMADGI
jgi:PTS system sucrose-specific IIC component